MHRIFICVALAAGLATAEEKPSPKPPPEVKWNVPDVLKLPDVEHRSIKSAIMEQEMGFNVWTPPGYAASAERYPVIYFLHGSGGNENSDVGGFTNLVKQAIEEKKAPPVLCVFPNGGNSGYRDRPNGNTMMETFAVKELIPYVDANWRTIASPVGRVTAGFSMGGGGAVRWALQHPDTFSAAASWAGGFRKAAFEYYYTQMRENADKIRGHVRLMLIVGDKDQTYPFHAEFIAELKDLKFEHEYQVLPGVDHNLGKYWHETGMQVLQFLGNGFGGK